MLKVGFENTFIASVMLIYATIILRLVMHVLVDLTEMCAWSSHLEYFIVSYN
jgi:hypothetical protein